MIDNVVMLITGALKQREVTELLPRCHPLGAFDQMAAVGIARTPSELYSAILVDTPLGNQHTSALSETLEFFDHQFHNGLGGNVHLQ